MGSAGRGMMHITVDNSCPKEIMSDTSYRNNVHILYVRWGRVGERSGLYAGCLKRKGQTFSSKEIK